MKNEIRTCAAFQENLRAYLDSELHADERDAMNAHAERCPDCAEELNCMTRILTMCAEIDEGLVMPAAVKDAWRQAVREAAAKKRKPALGFFARSLSAVAAALLILVVGTQALRQQGSIAADRPENMSAPMPSTMEVQRMRLFDGAEYGESGAGFQTSFEDLEYVFMLDDSVGEPIVSPMAATLDAPGARISEVKLMRSANRTIETTEFDADMKRITDLVHEYGRFERQEVRELSKDSNGIALRRADMLVRVLSDQMDDFLRALEAVGKIAARSEYNEDVSGRYLDTQIQIDSLNTQIGRLNEIMKTAETVKDTITIEDKIRQLINERDSLQRTINGWDDSVKYARISLYVNEVTVREMIEAEDQSLGDRVRNNFQDSFEWLVEFLQDALVVLAMIAPQLVIWVPALILVIVIIRVVVKRLKK